MAQNMVKYTPEELYTDSFALGKMVLETYKPTFVVALWRGGTPIGMILKELFDYCKLPVDHCAVKTSSYQGSTQADEVKVYGLEYVFDHATPESKILLVDDIFDTGNTIKTVLTKLREHYGDECPETKVATLFFNDSHNHDHVPDFYLKLAKSWIVFPHEIIGLTLAKIEHFQNPEIAKTVGQAIKLVK